MEASLSLKLLIFSTLWLGVYSNCDLRECSRELQNSISSPYFCNSTDVQKDAIAAIMKCVYSEEGTEEACPEEVRNAAPDLAEEMQAKYATCSNFRQSRASCGPEDYFLCIAGLGNFAFAYNIATITEISEACTILKPILSTVDLCKSCIGNAFGDAWNQVKDTVEAMWASATSLIGGACDCAARIQDTINNVDYTSTCKTIEFAQKAAEGIAQNCLVDLVESYQTYDWLTLLNNYIKSIGIYTRNACFFAGQSSSPAAIAISPALGVLVFFANFFVLRRF